MCNFKVVGPSSSNCCGRAVRLRAGLLILSGIFAISYLNETRAAQVSSMPPGAESDISGISAGVDQGIMLAKNEKIYVQVDQAKILRLPADTRAVIVGNPMVADISTLRDGMGVLTAKSFGTTNLIVLGEKGEVLLETLVGVTAIRDNIVVVQRGFERETYSCSPTCQPLMQIGDGNVYFDSVKEQIKNRNTLSTQK